MKKWSISIVALVLFAALTAQVWAAQPIKLLVNGPRWIVMSRPNLATAEY